MNLRSVVALMLASLLGSGCAGFSLSEVRPGTPAAHVEATAGPPTDRIAEPDGSSVWLYARNPYGRVTYAVRVGPNGLVRDVEQRLSEENLKKLIVDETTGAQVRALFGPPNLITRFERQQRDIWEYPMIPGNPHSWMMLYVDMSYDGIVKEQGPASFLESEDAQVTPPFKTKT